jgi:hypothetical protein
MSLGIDFPGFVRKMTDLGFPTELASSPALDGYRSNVQLFERLASLVRSRSAFSGQATLFLAAAGNESRRGINPEFEKGHVGSSSAFATQFFRSNIAVSDVHEFPLPSVESLTGAFCRF